MQVRLTPGSESLLLRSPKASEGQGGALGEAEALKRGNTVGVRDQIMDLVASQGAKVSRTEVNDLLPTTTATYGGTSAESHLSRKPGRTKVTDLRMIIEENLLETGGALLPTPNTMDHLPARTPEQKAANRGKGGYANVRETVVNDLLPTPKALDGEKENLKTSQERLDSGHQVDLPNVAIDLTPNISWGKFEPAIRRWENILGRPAPAPTKPDGKDGAHRLSSKFTEWMMGLPDGWITDCGLTRNEELKACGNGVVPQQAELALRHLLEGIPLPTGGGASESTNASSF
jgi:DNA (cytosine-5)-methyltransferase 1